MGDFPGKNIVIGVTGGIAAYKVVELARMLIKRGANVKVIMTDAAQRFVAPLTFRAITGNPVTTRMFSDPGSPLPHISLGEEADLIVVAPATANIIAKYARGIADDLLSTTLLAARGAVIVAPAMNTRMYLNPVTVENISSLRGKGVILVEPGEGDLACGDEGIGRLAEPARIMDAIEREIDRVADLTGKKVLVTAGPTWERIDPVRFISNPSTGRMGFAVADRASQRGAEVILVAGPTSLTVPAGVKFVPVISAGQMRAAVLDRLEGCHALVMAAAVADFRPAKTASRKLKKSDGVPEIKLEPTDDILNEVSKVRGECLIVGFAAETEDVVKNARKKLEDKKMDLVVANKVDQEDSGFAARTNMAAIISPGDKDARLSTMSKVELADLILDRISGLLG